MMYRYLLLTAIAMTQQTHIVVIQIPIRILLLTYPIFHTLDMIQNAPTVSGRQQKVIWIPTITGRSTQHHRSKTSAILKQNANRDFFGTTQTRFDHPGSTSPQQQPFTTTNVDTIHRGGASNQPQPEDSISASNDKNTVINDHDDDNERYSRQLFTLGAKAHGYIRSSTVYIDGPIRSGLVYECCKNLALSGVRNIVIVTNKEDHVSTFQLEQNYHDPNFDDLGTTYQTGARNEIVGNYSDEIAETVSHEHLLIEYIRRLNPGVNVSQVSRSSLVNESNDTPMDDANRAVVLCIDRPLPTVSFLNTVARNHNWAFVVTETAGVFGKVFCDFGTNFVVNDSDGETPLNIPLDRIDDNIDNSERGSSNDIVIHCIDGERHDVSNGDFIQFLYRDGVEQDKSSAMEQFVVVDVQTPYRIVVQPVINDNETQVNYTSMATKIRKYASSFSRIKLPQTLSFETFDTVMQLGRSTDSLFTPSDLDKSFDIIRRWASLSCFQAMNDFVAERHRIPTEIDIESFMVLVKQVWPLKDLNQDAVTKHVRTFLRACKAKFSPLQCVFGAISAQEVLKAITGLYNPVHQVLLYDCDEIIDDDNTSTCKVSDTVSPLSQSSPALRYILGDDTVNKLQSSQLFVVGSGAIGCELLKNLASMGAGTISRGKVVVTDMDSIEKSNLSRQLLFRDGDIGKFKSTAAQEALLRMNPHIRIQAHSTKVGQGQTTDNDPFNEDFWAKDVDVVLNALDNVEARLYMDKQCVINRKALIDAGTMGPKGNVQVVVPFQSESYASSADPPEPSIPICTLKNFPYAISHTIQWGRDLFEGLFQRRPEQSNDFLESLKKNDVSDLSGKFLRENGVDAAIETATELQQDLSAQTLYDGNNLSEVRTNAIDWAVQLAVKLFHFDPHDLLLKHPVSSLDDEGLPFWTGSRRPPMSLVFDLSTTDKDQSIINENFVEFVRNCARLRVESIIGAIGGASIYSAEEARDACSKFFDVEIVSSANDDEPEIEAKATLKIRELLEKVVPRDSRLMPIAFEKDDEANGHVAFVNAASNLRALVYGIPTVDTMETRRIAGRIVPAMISTTAFVSAISCIELVKLVQNAELRRHRNAFINLALPFFAFTVPVPADTIPGLDGKHYTLWDQLSIKESEKASMMGGITMKILLKKIKKLASSEPTNVQVVSISAGDYLLYANFLHESDQQVLKSSLWDQVQEALSMDKDFNSRDPEVSTDATFSVNDTYIDLTVVVEQVESNEEIELPPVRVHRFRQQQ